MFSFLKKMGQKKVENLDESVNAKFKKLKELYNYDSITDERKKELKHLIEENGYLPYPYIKALEEFTNAEVLYALELKLKKNGVYNANGFKFENDKISPAQRAGFTSGDWIKKEQHNIKLINLAGLGDGNKTQETGKLIDWLRQVVVLPSGMPEKGVLGTTVYLIPFHPREFGCAYLPVSSEVSPNLEDKQVTEKTGMNVFEQVQFFVSLAQLAGHCVIYDVLPQTGRFSKMVLANPYIARWFDINELIEKIQKEADIASDQLKSDETRNAEDIDVVNDIYKNTLKKGSHDLSEHFQIIYDEIENLVAPKKKEFSDEMMKKENQTKLQARAAQIVAEINDFKPNQKYTEDDVKKHGETVQKLIQEGLWPAPGGAWCSAGTPVFNKMAESGEYPTFKHFDYKGDDVTHFANLDCQTPFYFVYLENGKYNEKVIDFYVEHMKKIQSDYNFDGFRVDHIDHIVDSVSEKDGVPISYRAPRKVLGRVNKELKEKIPHFATLAEYMLWDKYYKEYHDDMNFDILWGNDIISQFSKNPEEIINNNQDLEEFNVKNQNSKNGNLSILKSYNNQDGEFRAIDQYPGQLGEDGALFKWFKYKFIPGGKNAQRPVMFIDGDESFTKTGIESVIGAEVSMPREKNYKFFDKFNAINKFALENVLTREGEAQIIAQDSDGFTSWMISKDPLKTSLLVVANYQAPTEKVTESNDDGGSNTYIKEGKPVYDKKVQMPCDCKIVAEYAYNDDKASFEEIIFENPESELVFGELKPSDFKIYKVSK